MFSAFSRRRLLQAGSAVGFFYLAGCARPEQEATGPLPGPAWPNPAPTPPPTYTPPQREVAIGKQSDPVIPSPPGSRQLGTLPPGVLPRSRWTTAGLANPGNARPMNGVSFITVHHDGLPQSLVSETEQASITRLNLIRDSHAKRLSKAGERWADIGYHYIIDRAGRVWEGRPIYYQGAHVQDCNEHNIGVMCMGNFMQQAPSKAQTDALDRFVAQLMRDNRIPLRNVKTHKEWAPTECPGTNLQRYMVMTRGRGGTMALALTESDPSLIA